MRLRHCPPSSPSPLLMLLHLRLIFSLAYNPYAPAGPSSHASNTALVPLTPPHTCLILSAAYHPYTCVVPSQHASYVPYHPYACEVPSRHAYSASYHPYTHIVPSRHASNAAYHPYACSALPTCF
ncbi:hypothetical protein O181_090124 [Austropuccinia psidii MF-1]|uniref:Uncharacterized protein n=1 Tax=Austropuccinia psidii MF-1 TaxID=1389203 RepID=A0A9Q3IUU4_9BASI|nr:hypothetical protein [Austropuccinia psidii MF-1]